MPKRSGERGGCQTALGRVGVFFWLQGLHCMEEAELVVSEDEMCSLRKELASILSALLVEGQTLSKPLRALVHLSILTG